MGARSFMTHGTGLSLSAALQDAKDMTRALTENGGTLYGGTILGKDWARELLPPASVPQTSAYLQQWAVRLLHPEEYDVPEAEQVGWVQDKGAPVAAVKLALDPDTQETTWLFFGWAAM